jgi:hypothetical protein
LELYEGEKDQFFKETISMTNCFSPVSDSKFLPQQKLEFSNEFPVAIFIDISMSLVQEMRQIHWKRGEDVQKSKNSNGLVARILQKQVIIRLCTALAKNKTAFFNLETSSAYDVIYFQEYDYLYKILY